MLVSVRPLPMPVLVDLVNGWGAIPRAAAGEEHLPHPPLAVLAPYQDQTANGRPTLTDDQVRAVADLVYPVFAEPHPSARVRLVNALLTQVGVRPCLSASAHGVEAGWLVERSDQVLLGAAATALLAQLRDHEPARLGTCGGRRCADAFADSSPAGQRRFCSVTCQNRARVAAFRRRQAASTEPATGSGQH